MTPGHNSSFTDMSVARAHPYGASPTMNSAVVNLTGVPETMLWTLHNGACEARRADAFLHDPDCVRIYESIDYDYARSFGRSDGSHPMRSKLFDAALKPWLATHRGGTVVELAAGLETQFQRCDDGQVQWLCVDVPEAIAVRARFLPASPRCRCIAKSALDASWMDEVDGSRGVFVTAQGLFMYFDENAVKQLFVAMVERFPGVQIMFDVIPPWFSKKTCSPGGFRKTRHYVAPPMPWGVRCSEVGSLLLSWSSRVLSVSAQPYGFARGLPSLMQRLFTAIPGLRDVPPCIVQVMT